MASAQFFMSFQSFKTLPEAPIGLPYKTEEEARPFYEKIIKNLSCCKDGDCKTADLACLRAKTTKELQKAAWNLGEMRPENFPGKVFKIGCSKFYSLKAKILKAVTNFCRDENSNRWTLFTGHRRAAANRSAGKSCIAWRTTASYTSILLPSNRWRWNVYQFSVSKAQKLAESTSSTFQMERNGQYYASKISRTSLGSLQTTLRKWCPSKLWLSSVGKGLAYRVVWITFK